MPIYNLIEYSSHYFKNSGNLWQYYTAELSLNNAGEKTGEKSANEIMLK